MLIVLDNFRVGGLERLALDQLYALKDMGIEAEAQYRQVEVTHSMPNFLSLEERRISEKKIKITGLPKTDLGQLRHFFRLFSQQDFGIVINHSVGAAVILKSAIILTRKKAIIKTFIHQLPTLSAPKQRLKRFIYSLFSDEVYGYSSAVVEDWNKRISKRILPRAIRQLLEIKLLRNGIYLSRLPSGVVESPESTSSGRMVFIGRNVGWKNLNRVFSLLRNPKLATLSALIIVPMIDEEIKNAAELEFSHRIQFQVGKKIEDVDFRAGDVNIYPVDYGPDAKFIEAISLNCLEMACIGIPSLIARHGSSTWPDLVNLGYLYEVNWNDEDEVADTLENLATRKFHKGETSDVAKVVSIENNVKAILKAGSGL